MTPRRHTPVPPPPARPPALLALAAVAVLLGRGYEYVSWGGPLRSLAWDQQAFWPVAAYLYEDWAAYAADLRVDATLSALDLATGAVFGAGACAVAYLRYRRSRVARGVLTLAAAASVAHVLLSTRAHFSQVAYCLEHAIQVGLPLLCLWTAHRAVAPATLLLVVKALTAVTFVAHGLYALGVYPVPGHFVDMTIGLTGLSEGGARAFLLAAGGIDLALGLLLFAPVTERAALAYAVLWGLATALARVAYGFDAGAPAASLHASAYATALRLGHGLVPMFGLLLASRKHAPNVLYDGGSASRGGRVLPAGTRQYR